jgi:adenylate kinase family enzyme
MAARPTITQQSELTLGDVGGGIAQSILAGGNVYINRLVYGDNGDARARNRILSLVSQDWVEGFLASSLGEGAFVPLLVRDRSDLLEISGSSPIKDVVSSDLTVLFQSDLPRSILILGEPGSGKTTLLLETAKSLIHRASVDNASTLPVVLNLSLWRPISSSRKRQTASGSEDSQYVIDWLSTDIANRYRLPKYFVTRWLSNGQLTLILDGLDEVAKPHRDDCVEALNVLLKTNLCNVIISSRLSDYEELSKRLTTDRAISIEPLSAAQIKVYLDSRRIPAAPLIETMTHDADLAELARSPLMLSVLAATIKEGSHFQLSGGSLDDKRQVLFAAHTKAMFARRAQSPTSAGPRMILLALRTTAVFLRKHLKSQFQVEDLDSTVIETKMGKLLFGILFWIAAALFVASAAFIALLIGYRGFFHGHPVWASLIGAVGIGCAVSYTFHVFYAKSWKLYDSLTISATGAGLGLLSGAVFVVVIPVCVLLTLFLPLVIAGTGLALLALLPGWLLLILALVFLGAIIYNLEEVWNVVLGWVAFSFGVQIVSNLLLWISGAIADDRYAPIIQIYDAIWTTISRISGVGLEYPGTPWHEVMGTLIRLGLSGGIIVGICGIVIGGVRAGTLNQKRRPGHSLNKSLANSIYMSALATVSTAIIVYGCHIVFGETGSREPEYRILAACIGVAVFVLLNGPFVVRHFILRGVLAVEGTLPFRLIKTFEEAVDRILLRRITSGFFFIHKMQLDYFASLSEEELRALLTEIERSRPE